MKFPVFLFCSSLTASSRVTSGQCQMGLVWTILSRGLITELNMLLSLGLTPDIESCPLVDFSGHPSMLRRSLSCSSMSSIFAVSMMMTVSAMLTGLCDVDTGVRTSLTVSLCLLAMSLRDHEIQEPDAASPGQEFPLAGDLLPSLPCHFLDSISVLSGNTGL